MRCSVCRERPGQVRLTRKLRGHEEEVRSAAGGCPYGERLRALTLAHISGMLWLRWDSRGARPPLDARKLSLKDPNVIVRLAWDSPAGGGWVEYCEGEPTEPARGEAAA
jgi:hypothetical protein